VCRKALVAAWLSKKNQIRVGPFVFHVGAVHERGGRIGHSTWTVKSVFSAISKEKNRPLSAHPKRHLADAVSRSVGCDKVAQRPTAHRRIAVGASPR
jgi:hypothetical protein